jgi:hypothetical protein
MIDEPAPPGTDEPPDERDEAIMLDLQDAWTDSDPPPTFLVDQMRLTLGLIDVGAEALRLIGTQRLAVSRGEEQTKRITFSDDHLTIMISVDDDPTGTVRVDGWVAPGGPCRIVLVVDARSVTAEADSDGRFSMVDVPRGMARLVIEQSRERQRMVGTPVFEL